MLGNECIWECIVEATSFLHWWQMWGLVHWAAQMTHMYVSSHIDRSIRSVVAASPAHSLCCKCWTSLGMYVVPLSWAFFTLDQYASSAIIHAIHGDVSSQNKYLATPEPAHPAYSPLHLVYTHDLSCCNLTLLTLSAHKILVLLDPCIKPLWFEISFLCNLVNLGVFLLVQNPLLMWKCHFQVFKWQKISPNKNHCGYDRFI
jgi:hypothetical protein